MPKFLMEIENECDISLAIYTIREALRSKRKCDTLKIVLFEQSGDLTMQDVEECAKEMKELIELGLEVVEIEKEIPESTKEILDAFRGDPNFKTVKVSGR